nr:putative ribonuclease H-like domain-containing protein [Tanacetum cinerariifolium]GEV75113.1 putative ribonuclease H-like domain-containing protein [Tanacetum cinerariifolium]
MRHFGCPVTILNTLDPLGKFDRKEPEFEGRKPESEVHVSPSSSKSPVESLTRYRNLSAEFEDFSANSINKVNAVDSSVSAVGQILTNSINTFSAGGPSNDVVSSTHGKFSYMDTSQLPDDLNMPELEDITYSDDEEDIEAMEEEILQFKMQKVWVLVDLPHEKQAIGHTQEEGINYEEVFAPVAKIEAIRLFLAYASFMGFMVYQMDVKSAFLYRTIKEEVYVCQPPGYEDPDYHDKVYKVVKALYGLHQALRAWYETLANYLLENGFQKGKIDQALFIKRQKGDILLVQIYVDDIIFGSTNKDLCKAFEKLMNDKFQISSMGASEEFDQIVDLLNASSIKYALTVNPNIYVSCIKQFWTSVSVKKVNDVTRLQALVDKNKVVITEATIRDALRLADAEGIDCLPNEEIFAKLSRMGYEKPFTKLTFYKAFFSQQWKFLIHTILQCMSAKWASWNGFSSYMASAIICLSTGTQVGDLSSHTTKYSSPALTQKVFANIRRVGKGCSGVETPLLEGMIVASQAGKGAAEGNVNDVPAVGVAIEVQHTPPPSPIAQPPLPQQQPQPSHDAAISMDILHNLLDTCTTLTRRVENLKQDKIAQVLEITKLNQRERIIADIDADVDVTLKDIAKDVAVDAEIEESANDDDIEPAKLHEVVKVVTTAKLVTEVVTAASATITAAALQLTTAAVPTLTIAPSAARRRKRVVIRDPEETATPSTIIHSEAKSKDKGKGILVKDPKPFKNQAQIEQDEAYARELKAELNKKINWDDVIDQVQRKEKKDNVVMRYQALKKKPKTKAQARKNMMIYIRNMAGFKMDYFKGMKYDDIRPIFEKYFNSNVAFLEKTKEQMEEEDIRALKRISETQEEKVAKK